MPDKFDGDPFIIIGADGADWIFIGGQPVMDQGLVNHVNIAALTYPGWWGNDIEPVAERRIESKFIVAAAEPITRQSLLDDAKAAEADIKGDEFSKVTAEVTNPISQQLRLELLLQPPSNEFEILILERVGQNWINQKLNPAYIEEIKSKDPGVGDGLVYRYHVLLTTSGAELLTTGGDNIIGRVKE